MISQNKPFAADSQETCEEHLPWYRRKGCLGGCLVVLILTFTSS